MNRILTASLILSLLIAPHMTYAQHGHGGGGRGGGGGFRGGPGGGGQGGRGYGGGGYGGGARGDGGSARGGGGQGGNAGGSRGNDGRARGDGGNRTASHAPAAHANSFAHHGGGNMQFSHRPAYHGGWYHGDWHGRWGQPWGYRPVGWYGGWGWGFGAGIAIGGAVALGSPWGWGYYNYWNPYWAGPIGGVTYINYSQPIVYAPPAAPPVQIAPQPTLPGPSAVASPAAAGASSGAQEKALATFDSARSYFARGDYTMALAQVNRAVALLPNDSLMHEFRALCLFALKDYKQSAAALYAVLSAGPGWDLATVNGLYPNTAIYAEQVRALENYRDEDPRSASARFVLAYHYMLAGRNEQAATELAAVVALEPKDQLSAQLLKGLNAAPGESPVAEPTLATAEPVDAARLVGNWHASRPDGSKIELRLSGGNQFSWDFEQNDKPQHLSGKYTIADNYLILTASGQNALVARVSLGADDQLKFKLADGGPADPGLTFTR